MAGILFIISAPSGSGKSTLVNALRQQVGAIDFSISWTTRKPRGSEEQGREYHFATREEFERMRDAGEFLEHAEVFGNYYGTARRSLDEATAKGHDLLLDIDVQGAKQVRETVPGAISIFVMPPNPKVLRTRLRNRSRAEGQVDEPELFRRLNEAKKEISEKDCSDQKSQYSCCPNYQSLSRRVIGRTYPPADRFSFFVNDFIATHGTVRSPTR